MTPNGKLTCPKTQQACAGTCHPSHKQRQQEEGTLQYVRSSDGEWMKPLTMEDLMGLLQSLEPGKKYRLVAGNTGTGNFFVFE